jgi:hypothetical protein
MSAVESLVTTKKPVDGALILASRGVPQIPLGMRTKAAVLSGWQEKATVDPVQISAWEGESPERNYGSVALAQAGGFLFFEIDSNDVLERIKDETGQTLPATFAVRSSPGRGHFYFKQTAASIELGNIAQGFVKHQDWSLRVDREYVVSPMSWHPKSGAQYEILRDEEIVEAPAWLLFWMKSQRVQDRKQSAPDNGGPIPEGGRNSTLTSLAGKARQVLGLNEDELLTYLLRVNDERCTPPLSRQEVETIAGSIARYDVKPDGLLRNGQPMGLRPDIMPGKTIEEASAVAEAEDERRRLEGNTAVGVAAPAAGSSLTGETIPAFDDSLITGVFRDVVDLATEGTSMPRQFAFLAAKVFVGARLSTGMQFEGIDGDSAYYGTAIGLTGTGKGLAWRRVVDKILAPNHVRDKGVKLFTDVDSGAGLRDSFFEPPENQPVLLYIDEVTALGHKAGEKKNPEIIDAIITLANSSTITRMKSKKSAKDERSIRTHENAHLSVYMCGQDGPAYMASFAGKTKIGLWDRFYPEFSEPVEAGELPDIEATKAGLLFTRVQSMPFSGKMTMNDEVRQEVEMFWKAQPAEVRTKVRFKVYFVLDMYLAAWGQGRMVAQIDDYDVAVRIFQRQLVIRREHFRGEIPDRVGYYVGLLKKIVEGQRERLNTYGEPASKVAMSMRDYQTDTHAYRDNEVQTFMQAWRVFNEQHMVAVLSLGKNGQMYEKFLPMPYEHETFLPQEQSVRFHGRDRWVVVV